MRKSLLAFSVMLLSQSSLAPCQKVARLTQDLRLDATTEDFPSVRAVAVGPRGQIAVGIPQDNQLRLYDGTGKKLGIVGRTGSGPGEFRGIGAIGWIGDTMYVNDYQLRRTSFFAPDLKLLRTVPDPMPRVAGAVTPAGDLSGVRFSPSGLYADGTMFGGGSISHSSSPNQPWERFLGFMSPSGDVRRVPDQPTMEDPKWQLFFSGFYRGVPFIVSPQIGWATDGSRYAFMTVDNRERDGGVVTIASYKRDGSVDFTKKMPFKGVPIPGGVRDSVLASFIPPPGRPTEGPSDLPQRFQAMAKERMPSFYPPVESLIPRLDSTLWIMLPTTNDQYSANVLDGHGNMIGTVVPPKKSRIRFGTATHVWVSQRDADDLISVVRYRISW